MKLNIGCGPVVADGWVNVDADDEWADLHDVERGDPLEGLRWPDDSFEGAVAHHVLQMIAWPDLVPWLTEVRRVLEPGGVLRTTVPDLWEAMRQAAFRNSRWFPVEGETVDEQLCVYLSQNGATRSVFTGMALALLFRRAGFVDIAWRSVMKAATSGPEWLTSLDSRLEESLVVEGAAP